MHPFYVLGTPRSRTAWLAAFLSTEDRVCMHEPSRTMRDLEELTALLMNPAAAVSDSLLSLRWRHVVGVAPGARIVVVKRPLAHVAASFVHLGVRDRRLQVRLGRLSDALEELRCSAPVLWVPYETLAREATCALVYEYCRGVSVPDGLWEQFARVNVQVDFAAAMAEAAANAGGMRKLFPELTEDV